MFARHLSNASEVLCREFFGELPGGVPAASLRHRDAMRGNQDRPVFQVAHAKRTSGRFRPNGHATIQTGAAVGGVKQRDDNASSSRAVDEPRLPLGSVRRRSLVFCQGRKRSEHRDIRLDAAIKVGFLRSRLEPPLDFHVHSLPHAQTRADYADAGNRGLAGRRFLAIFVENSDHFRRRIDMNAIGGVHFRTGAILYVQVRRSADTAG